MSSLHTSDLHNQPRPPTTAPASEPVADVVVPVLNEVEMLPRFLARVAALKLPLRLICVDNGSRDGTLELLRARPEITLIEHGRNLGYGRSLADGLLASRAERVVIIDADCEYPPEAIPVLLAGLERAPVVYASRFLGGRALDMSPLRQAGNRLLTAIFNLLYGQRLTDLYTGMKALRREAFQGLAFRYGGFEHVVELAAGLARRGLVLAEAPVEYTPRQTGRSKMRHLPEVLKALGVMLKLRVAGRA
ncbi:MAG: glycosyltransferase family 2 protein [Thermodesulfobacteriota bacterium]